MYTKIVIYFLLNFLSVLLHRNDSLERCNLNYKCNISKICGKAYLKYKLFNFDFIPDDSVGDEADELQQLS